MEFNSPISAENPTQPSPKPTEKTTKMKTDETTKKPEEQKPQPSEIKTTGPMPTTIEQMKMGINELMLIKSLKMHITQLYLYKAPVQSKSQLAQDI